ncbi:MAG: hypothetical protein P8Y13_14845, partial [Deinococcales bacterium]
MSYDPWELESRLRERQRRLQQEIEDLRRVALWRRGADTLGARPAGGPWRRAMVAVQRLLGREAMKVRSEVAREG